MAARYSKKELKYIRENLFNLKPKTIAKNLERSLPHILKIMRSMIGDYKGKLWDFNTVEAAKILGITPSTFRVHIRSGNVEYFSDIGGGKQHYYLFTVFNLRDFVVKHDFNKIKIYKCITCSKKIRGDLFCPSHLPIEFQKHLLPKEHPNIICRERKQALKKIGEIAKQIRIERGKSKKQLIDKMYIQDINKINVLEKAKNDDVFLGTLIEYFKALDCTVKITIEKNPSTW